MARKVAMAELIAAVRAHAETHYERNGWDFVVECYSDNDIAEILADRQITSKRAAIKEIGAGVRLQNERRTEIEGTAF